MIKLGNTVSVKGHYILEKYDAKTNKLKQVLEFDNVILNQIFDALYTGNEYYRNFEIVLGTGTSTPLPTNTGLDNKIVAASCSVNKLYSNSAPDYAVANKYSTRFNAGAINNTITEIGLRVNLDGYITASRSLILDNNGNPTSLTVAENEYLDISYILTYYPNLTETTGTFELDGVTYEYLNKPINVTNISLNFRGNGYLGGNLKLRLSDNNTPVDITTALSSSNSTGSISRSTYITGTYKQRFQVTLELNQGNFDTGIGSVTVHSGFIATNWNRITFTPKLPKDNTCQMTFQFESPQITQYTPPSTGD